MDGTDQGRNFIGWSDPFRRAHAAKDYVAQEERLPPLDRPVFKFTPSTSEARVRLDERHQIARELHDSTSQLLAAMDLQVLRLRELSKARTSEPFDTLIAELRLTIASLHKEVREVSQLNPRADNSNEDFAAMANDFAAKTGIAVQTDIDALPESVSGEAAHALYRVAQEALANVSRHAKASSVEFSVRADAKSVTLRVADNGVGFPSSSEIQGEGLGIANMTSRMTEVGGELITSNLNPGAMVSAKIDLEPLVLR